METVGPTETRITASGGPLVPVRERLSPNRAPEVAPGLLYPVQHDGPPFKQTPHLYNHRSETGCSFSLLVDRGWHSVGR